MEKIGYSAIAAHEKPLMERCLKGFAALEAQGRLTLVGPKTADKRIGLFSFTLPSDKNPFQLGQYLADHNVCMRVGGQCAQPFHQLMHL